MSGHNRKTLVVIAAVTMTATTGFAIGQSEGSMTSINDTTPTNSSDVRATEVGKALRAAIDVAYREAKKSKGARGNDPSGVDASSVVRQYIHPGQRIASAQAILREAGFVLREEPQTPSATAGTPRHTIIGNREPLEEGALWRYHSSIRVVIEATDAVNEVQAAFHFPMS